MLTIQPGQVFNRFQGCDTTSFQLLFVVSNLFRAGYVLNPFLHLVPAFLTTSDFPDFVNGHVLYVDGGILAYIGKQPK